MRTGTESENYSETRLTVVAVVCVLVRDRCD